MKLLILMGFVFMSAAFATGTKTAAPAAAATAAPCKPAECFSVGFNAFEKGQHHIALPILEPMCNKDNNAAACHLVGIMYFYNKTEKDAKAKSAAAFNKACVTLKYQQACADQKKHQ
jgi:hypothetical protein